MKNPAAYMAVKQVIERENQNLPNGVRIPHYGPAREKIVDGIEAALNTNKIQEALDITVKEAQAIIDGK